MNTNEVLNKLIAEIEFAKSVYSNPNRVVHGIADAFRQDGRAAMCDDILKQITSLQQEQPEVNLEKEIEKQIRSIFYDLDGIAIMGTSKYASVDDMEYVARHFYELGQRTKYQQDR